MGAEVVGEVPRRLVQADAIQASARQPRLDLLPKRDDEVFRRRDDVAKEIDVRIEILVVALPGDRRLEDLLQLAEIDHIPRDGVGRAGHGHLEDVVVTMPMRAGAEAVLLLIPSLALGRVFEPMGRVEMHLPRDVNRARKHAHVACRTTARGLRAAGIARGVRRHEGSTVKEKVPTVNRSRRNGLDSLKGISSSAGEIMESEYLGRSHRSALEPMTRSGLAMSPFSFLFGWVARSEV